MNTLGGLQPDTVAANISGSLQDFWGVLNDAGYVLNWDGSVSPVVHQLDHFLGELEDVYDRGRALPLFRPKSRGNVNTARRAGVGAGGAEGVAHEGHPPDGKEDRGWQALAVAKCLWGCPDSPTFGVDALKS